MRGSSALAGLLHDHASPSLHLLVVWEPVIASDVAPPRAALVAQFSDVAREEQFWDPSHVVSRAVLERTPRDARFDVSSDGTLWDTLLVYAPGARWDAALPPPRHAGSDVIDDVPILARELP